MMMPSTPAKPMPGPQGPQAMPPTDQTGYPSGGEIMAQQGTEQAAMANTENPGIAAIRTIVMLVGSMKQNQDPRADAAIEALQGLIQALTGSGEIGMPPQGTQGPQGGAQPPAPPPGMEAGPGAPAAMPGPAGAPAPAPAAPMGGPGPAGPAAPPAPGPNLVSQFEEGAPPPAAPTVKPRPMGPVQAQKGRPMGKQSVVLT